MSKAPKDLIQKIRQKIGELPPEGVSEVLDFVDFLRSRRSENSVSREAAKLSEKAFASVWDNPEDAEYDKL